MSYFRLLTLLTLSTLFMHSCMPPDLASKREADKINIDLSDPQVQKIYNFRDQRNTDSLKVYLKNPDATLRYLAALSFASFVDSTQLDVLSPMLSDPNEQIRTAAAFSMGQSHSLKAEAALIKAFAAADSLSQFQRFNAVVLEAVGKCGSPGSLKNIATVSTYQPTDTLLLEGQCRAIYQFGLRGITCAEGTQTALHYLTNEKTPEKAQLPAANYLARAKDLSPDSLESTQIAIAFVRSKNPNIRMALATALGRSNSKPAFAMLSKVIQTEKNWKVQCNLINALAKFEYDTVRNLVTPFLRNENPHVSRTAAEFFVRNGQAKDGDYYWRITTETGNEKMPWPTRIALFQASNRWISGHDKPESKDYVNYQIKEQFNRTTNPYERAACLHALAEFGWQYRWIHDKGINDAHPAVKTAAAEALTSIAQKPDFYRFFGEGARGVRRELYYYLKEIVASGDAGMIAAASEAFTAPALDFRTLNDTSRIANLRTALQALKMPRDLEAYDALAKSLAYFEQKDAPKNYKPAYNHPIDWSMFLSIQGNQKILVQTTKGGFTIDLLPEWAPGSCANFLQLINSGFFNGKAFHRVVPNFVIQTGCPRGDGYGALDYTIRSEIGLAWYDAPGYVGMASAGPDTEGTQWFVTHSPTPHLNGRYSIFGMVDSGMDVIDQIQVGDKIEKMSLTQ